MVRAVHRILLVCADATVGVVSSAIVGVFDFILAQARKQVYTAHAPSLGARLYSYDSDVQDELPENET